MKKVNFLLSVFLCNNIEKHYISSSAVEQYIIMLCWPQEPNRFCILACSRSWPREGPRLQNWDKAHFSPLLSRQALGERPTCCGKSLENSTFLDFRNSIVQKFELNSLIFFPINPCKVLKYYILKKFILLCLRALSVFEDY